QIVETVTLVHGLNDMRNLIEKVQELSPDVSKLFEELLKRKSLIYEEFCWSSERVDGLNRKIDIFEALDFAKEEMAREHLDCIFGYFSDWYRDHRHGTVLFFPISHTDNIVDETHGSRLGEDFIDLPGVEQYFSNGKSTLRRAYSFVRMGHCRKNLWGALAIDFDNHSFSFGYSKTNRVDYPVIWVVRGVLWWLKRHLNEDNYRKWEGAEDNIKLMKIGKQHIGNASS
ncbi:hypothetical protein BGZ49_006173, partial [Haplosporangium sp. Z 27]